jgi:hypothetical protein
VKDPDVRSLMLDIAAQYERLVAATEARKKRPL